MFFPFSEASSAFPRFSIPENCAGHFLLSFDLRDFLWGSLGSLPQGLCEEINQVEFSPRFLTDFFFHFSLQCKSHG